MAGDVDGCIDRLLAAVRTTGVAAPDGPGNVDALRRLEELIAPLELPSSLRRLWERVSPPNLPVGLWPDEPQQLGAPLVADPLLAFHAWMSARDFPGAVPGDLVVVSYSWPVWWFVRTDGAVLDWRPDSPFRRRFDRLEDLLSAAAQVIEEKAVRIDRYSAAIPGWVNLDRRRMDELAPAPVAVPIEPRAPAPEALPNIAEVLWSLPRRRRVRVGGLTHVMTETDRGQRVLVTDGSGLLDVWCPAAVPALPLLHEHPDCRLTVELDAPGWEPREDDKLPARWHLAGSAPPHGVVTDLSVRMFG